MVFRPRPDDPRRASGEGLDGSDPPFLTAGAVSRWGGGCGTRCGTPPHQLGIAPVSMYPCRKAPRPARRPDDQPHRAARCVTHSSAPSWSSAASAPRAPGRGRAYSPRPIPWPCSSATTRQTFTPSSSAGTTSRPAWPCSSRANFSSARRGSWFARMGVSFGIRSRLPAWPLSPTATGPSIVVGEVHHQVRAIESPTREWLMIPERRLSTGVAMFGAVGSGKTSACRHPFARQMARRRWRTPSILCLTVALGKLGGLKGCEVLRWLGRFGPVDNCLHCVVRGLVHVAPAGW